MSTRAPQPELARPEAAPQAGAPQATAPQAAIALRSAIRDHRAGRYTEAERAYRSILRNQPRHADALHLLALVRSEREDHEAARELLEAAIEIEPSNAVFHGNLGMVLMRRGEIEPAILAYCSALELEPRNARTILKLGRALGQLGQSEDALNAFRQAVRLDPKLADAHWLIGTELARRVSTAETSGEARIEEAELSLRRALDIDPSHEDAQIDLARLLAGQGRIDESIVHYRDSVRLNPDRPGIWLEYGNALHLGGRAMEAVEAYFTATERDPESAEAHFNLGVSLTCVERIAEAAECYRRAVRIKPDYAEAHNNLAILSQALGLRDEAADGYRRAVECRADFADARYNLALAMQDDGQLDEASAGYVAVLRKEPGAPDAGNNLGNTLLEMGRPQEAIEHYQQVLLNSAEQAERQQAGWNLSLARLLLGDLESGWAGYENRLAASGARGFVEPLWAGQPFPGRTLLIHAEQGLGDAIQFARYLDLAKQRGGTVILECHRELGELFRSCGGVDQVVARGADLPQFDFHAPLMSLPRIFQTTIDTIPAAVPYLRVDPELLDQWAARIGAGPLRRVGLVWAGNPKHKNDRNRSMTGSELNALAGATGVVFYSLQKHPGEIDPALPGDLPLRDLGPDLRSVADAAAAVAHLDLIISVDTMIAHLAGALARPVWTLLPFAPDWRWMLNRSDSPWYPTMRLFRQKRPGDWADVIEQVREALTLTVSDT